MKEYAIRVETIDGDVSYHRLTPDLVKFFDYDCLDINVNAVQQNFYPEYRIIDLMVCFDYVDSLEVI